MKEIEILITKNGKVTVEAFNFIGSSCSKFTEKLTENLGKVVESEKKPEYYQQESITINQKA